MVQLVAGKQKFSAWLESGQSFAKSDLEDYSSRSSFAVINWLQHTELKHMLTATG